MSVDINFSNHATVLTMIKEVQESETDARQAVRDAKLFIVKRDGQWDPYAWDKLSGRFRGTFDLCTPIVDQISGEMEKSDFTLRVSPSGGESSEANANILDGLIRNIRNISNAEYVFNQSGRSNIIGGFDAWEVVQDWIDGDSFDQDLLIKRIPDATNSVWFDLGSVMQDRSDAKWCIKLQSIPDAEYRERWPKGSGTSISQDKHAEAYFNKADKTVVGQLYYKKPKDIEIVQMTNGNVYQVDDDFKKVQKELKQSGITIAKDNQGNEKRRTRKSFRVHSRMLDGSDWLDKEQETVFDFLPVVPVYGNFDIVENKTVYYGKIEKLLDQQRVFNYAMSRDIEDGALSPSPSMWMTEQQAQGNDYSKMNTDHAPVRIYNIDDEAQTPPFELGGARVSEGLQATISLTRDMISSSANVFLAQQGNAAPEQSGIAGLQQIEQANIGVFKWFKALEVGICQTGKILVNAIPRVYDATRQVRILEEDGTGRIVTLNQQVLDQETGQIVELNNLTLGDYDVVCDVGPAFNSQQKETAKAFLDIAGIDPNIAQQGIDIWLKNLKAPGMDQMSERFRVQLLEAGVIPESQWTDEEAQKIAAQQQAAAQQPPPEDPNLILAKAEELKGQADVTNAQTKQQETQGAQQLKAQELSLEEQKIQLDVAKFQREKDDKFNVDAAKIQQDSRKLDLQEQKQQIDALMAQQKQQQQQINDAFNNLKVMREAMGVDSIVGPHSTKAYIEQAQKVDKIQEQ